MCEQADERLKSVGASAGTAQNGMYVFMYAFGWLL